MQRKLINTLVGVAMVATGFATGVVATPALAADVAGSNTTGRIMLAVNEATFDQTGNIDWISTKVSTDNIVIGDHSYTIGNNIRVHTPSGTTGLSALRPGVRVGFRASGKMISDLWVLPAE